MDTDKNSKVALVTGAAGGIGAAVARELGARGHAVAAVDADEVQLAQTVEKLRAEGARVHGFVVDVSNAAQVEAAFSEAERLLGPVHQLVNAAGVLRLGAAAEVEDEDWERTFAVNATGVMLCSRAAVRRMLPRRTGAIVSVASNAAGTPRSGMAAYAASKAAAEMYTKCLGLEVARSGIRCNVVAPGSTDTPMLRSMWRGPADERATLEGRPEAFRIGIPLGRVAGPEQVAASVLFLLSDQASHITMHTLTVDGGATLGV